MATSTEKSPGEAQAQRLKIVYEQLVTLLRRPDLAGHLRTEAGENEWSAMHVVGHLVEMIPYWLHHCRVIIAATGAPPMFGRTLDAPERLAGVERGASGELSELLGALGEEVEAAVRAIGSMSTLERARKGMHVRQGEMTVADILERFIVAHAEDHLQQAQAALRA